jgi:2-phosphosulfolactate phosphatase
MKININKYIDGAKEAIGIAVLIDVFRASNTIIACLHSGADYLVPVGDLQEAYDFKNQYPDHFLFGERGGSPPEGFDCDNSPVHASQMNLKGNKIIITTSAGSQGIVNAKNVDKLLIGSFANVEAIIGYIKKKNPENVSLIAIGNNASTPAIEDEECARYIKYKLLEQPFDFEISKKKILIGNGADRLRRLKQGQDLDFCTELNNRNIVPIFDRKNNRIVKAL